MPRGLVVAALLAAATAAACGRGKRSRAPTSTEASCRDVAARGQALIATAAAAEAEGATRFYAGLIDLCQAPGLSPSARSCLAAAPSLLAARACPSIAASIGDDDAPAAPGCRLALEHVLRLYDGDPDERPSSAEDRRELGAGLEADCEELNEAGVRCLLGAGDVPAVDDCLGEPAHAREPADDA